MLLSLLVVFPTLIIQGLCAYNVRQTFAWVDQSCNGFDTPLNEAGEDYTALVGAAYDALGSGLSQNKLYDDAVTAYMGTHDEGALLIQSRFNTLKQYGAGYSTSLSLYCDGSAFEWVTTYQEGDSIGQALPKDKYKEGGAWHTKTGRYNPRGEPLYIRGTERNDFCTTSQGKAAQGVSAIGSNIIVLCPPAFNDLVIKSLRAYVGSNLPAGTSLDYMTSLGAVMLHEMTHAILRTSDVVYGAQRCLILARYGASKAQQNADSYTYLSMALLLNQYSWNKGVAAAAY